LPKTHRASSKANASLREATTEQKAQKTIAEKTEEARRKAREFVDKEFSAADEATKLAYVNQKATEARAAAQKRAADEAKRAADEAKRAADQAERERKERERIAKQTQFISPVAGAPVTSGFGLRKAPKAGASTVHKGIDYGVLVGTAVRAPADGVVIERGFDSKLGKFVFIDHGNGTVSKFGHLSDNSAVSKGAGNSPGRDVRQEREHRQQHRRAPALPG
jgi:murein DD-endopeptidase MepM/ murein hydrolase activator NlpD